MLLDPGYAWLCAGDKCSASVMRTDPPLFYKKKESFSIGPFKLFRP